MAVRATQFVEVTRVLAEDEAVRVDLAARKLDQHVTEFCLVEKPSID
jgi:hypothetical protein